MDLIKRFLDLFRTKAQRIISDYETVQHHATKAREEMSLIIKKAEANLKETYTYFEKNKEIIAELKDKIEVALKESEKYLVVQEEALAKNTPEGDAHAASLESQLVKHALDLEHYEQELLKYEERNIAHQARVDDVKLFLEEQLLASRKLDQTLESLQSDYELAKQDLATNTCAADMADSINQRLKLAKNLVSDKKARAKAEATVAQFTSGRPDVAVRKAMKAADDKSAVQRLRERTAAAKAAATQQ